MAINPIAIALWVGIGMVVYDFTNSLAAFGAVLIASAIIGAVVDLRSIQ